MFRDLRDDLARRAPRYGGDWKRGIHPKVLASSVFLFFACLAPAVAFGGLMALETDGAIGTIEMIVATAACGVIYALFSGQPLTILGGTGPLLVFTAILYQSCKQLGVPFLPAYAWIGLWSGFFVVVMALTGASRLISLFTRFTDEIFSALISLIFIVQAVRDVAATYPSPTVPDDAALLSTLLALGTLYVASSLSRFRQGPYLRETMRQVLADFGPALAVVSMVAASRLLPAVELPHLNVPAEFGTSTGRPWLVQLGGGPSWLPFAAAGPALLVAVLVYLDQNITSRLVNSRDHRLEGGPAYHLDLLVVGVLLAVCSLFGLPWLVGATVRSLNHVRSLAHTEPDETGNVVVASVRENRVSPLAIHLLIGASLLATGLLRQVPMAVLYGLFLYMGVASMRGNELFERIRLWVTDPSRYPDSHFLRRVPKRTIHLFTLAQVICLVILWVVKSSRVGILFPLFIALLVPVRALVARVLPAKEVELLDSEEEPEENDERLAG